MWESVCSWATRDRCSASTRTTTGPGSSASVVEDVPHDAVDRLDAGDRRRAAGVVEPADVADLATAARVERRAVEHDPPRRGVDDHGVVLVEVGNSWQRYTAMVRTVPPPIAG